MALPKVFWEFVSAIRAIGEVYGATLENMTDVLHGISDKAIVTDPKERIFLGLPSEIKVGDIIPGLSCLKRLQTI